MVQEGGVSVRVMAGTHSGTTGPIEMRNPGLLMDVTLTKGSTFLQEVGFLLSAALSPLLPPLSPPPPFLPSLPLPPPPDYLPLFPFSPLFCSD